MSASGISFRAVSHTYRPKRSAPLLALEGVSLEVREREFLAILGPSGCGKSTLLYLLGGFLPIEAGEIAVAGRPIAGPGRDRGIVFQSFALYPWKTVRQNVLYGLEKQRRPRPERERRAQEDLQVDERRAVLDVPDVELDALVPRQPRPAVHLGPAGETGLDLEPPALPRRVALDLVGERGPRADHAHVAPDDVPELRQLVDREAPQEAARSRDARAGVRRSCLS